MKNISLSIIAMLFAATAVLANTPVKTVTKAKQAACTNCSKDKCSKKADCPKPTGKCVCK